MKNTKWIILSIFFISCDDVNDDVNAFEGKLVKKGICMNYVIQVNDSKFPNDMFEKD